MRVRNMARSFGWAASVLLLLVPAIGVADLPPPEGYVEQCTVENMETDGKKCRACDTDFRAGGCPFGQPYELACRTSGASVWSEVWCKDADAEDGPPPFAVVTDEPTEEPDPTEVTKKESPDDAEKEPAGPEAQEPAEKEPSTPATPAARSGCSVGLNGPASGSLLTLLLLLAGAWTLFRRRRRVPVLVRRDTDGDRGR